VAQQPTQPKKEERSNGVLYALLLLLLIAGGMVWWLLQPAPPPPPTIAKDPTPVPTAPPDAGEVAAAAPDAEPLDSGEPVRVAMVNKTGSKTERVGRKIEIPSTTKKKANDAGEAEEAEPDAAAPPPPDAGGPEDAHPAAKVEDAGPPIEMAEVGIFFREELPWLKTVSADVNLDGKNIARVEKKDGMEQNKDIPLFTGPLPVGIHSMTLRLKFIGDSAVFSYLEGYSFTMKHASKFESRSAKTTRAVIVATPKGNMTNDWKDRVALRIDVE
jgi:hypothetical protein